MTTAMTTRTPAAPARRARNLPVRRADARVLLDLISAAVFQPYRPLVAHLVVTRRCNLSCGYCTEYDDVSPPVPAATLRERIDHLARLRAVFVTLTGGEPLLHPELADIVAYVRERKMTPAMNTNGFLLTRERIAALGRAGLYAMQISVDNVTPNATTMKSLRPLLPKLRLLAEHAAFRVRVNTVLGAAPPAEAVEVARTALALGFEAKCSLLRDAAGAPVAVDDAARAAYEEIRRLGRRSTSFLSEDFQLPLLRGEQLEWKCRAGARFFHVCENGLVHLCAPRWNDPGVPLADYGEADLRRAFHAAKPCTAKCPVPYAHQASRLDAWRGQSSGSARPTTRLAPQRVHLTVIR
jgi:MoaA/NifB/PqqE/SkfB family radical SAM enzyme